MSKIEFVHLADTHLGYRQYGLDERFKDWGRATKQIIDYAVEKDVDAVVHAGDLFNSNKADQDALLQAIQILAPLKENDIPLLVIEGNHDRKRGRQKNAPMDVLDNLGYCVFLDPDGRDISNSTFNLDGYNFVGLGYPGMYLKKWIENFVGKLPEDEKNIPILHAGIEGYIGNFASHITPEKLKALKQKSVYLALGHYHDFFEIDNWIYNPGSVERERFDRRQRPKLFYHVDIDGQTVESERIEIDTRKMYQFDIDAEDHWNHVVEEVKNLTEENEIEDSLVRFRIHGKLESEFKRWELEEIVGEGPLVLKIFDDTYSEERKSEWSEMEIAEIENQILLDFYDGKVENAEGLSTFTKSLLERLLKNPPSNTEDAEPMAKDISEWRREHE